MRSQTRRMENRLWIIMNVEDVGVKKASLVLMEKQSLGVHPVPANFLHPILILPFFFFLSKTFSYSSRGQIKWSWVY